MTEKENRAKSRENLLNNIKDEENKNSYSSDLFNKKRIKKPDDLVFGKSRDEIKNKNNSSKNNSNIQKRKERLKSVDKSRQANVESLANALKAMKFVDLITKLNMNNKNSSDD